MPGKTRRVPVTAPKFSESTDHRAGGEGGTRTASRKRTPAKITAGGGGGKTTGRAARTTAGGSVPLPPSLSGRAAIPTVIPAVAVPEVPWSRDEAVNLVRAGYSPQQASRLTGFPI